MISIFDFIPSVCPNCGHKFKIRTDKLNRADYCAGCAHTCPECLMHFQFKPIYSDNLPDPNYWVEKENIE